MLGSMTRWVGSEGPSRAPNFQEYSLVKIKGHPRCKVSRETPYHRNCSRHGQKYLNPGQARIFFLSLVNMGVRATSGQFHLAAKKRVQLFKGWQQTTFPTRLQEAQQPILCEYID
ncbi:hypothetical protein BPOR_1155g00010 [Botrytis porri]|uniref:Uncharacterized protein n=1 Tax=Botrytis porri TaxID=87229 RepID=A0A4Z1K7I2_9HELO|nr:hypothetical protein BPOR_1155g00010 [Botrytis porri]